MGQASAKPPSGATGRSEPPPLVAEAADAPTAVALDTIARRNRAAATPDFARHASASTARPSTRLDAQIVKLLNERTQHILEIGSIKLKAGEEIYAPHRERAVLDRVCKLIKGPISRESLRAIYREVMSSALSLQKSMTIAFLGPEATFTHQAAIRRFGCSLRYSPQKTIADVFNEVSRNRAEYGVVPVENSTEGVVTHTLDMFMDSDLRSSRRS